MGNLWSVTDKDTDKMTKMIIDEIIKFINGNNEYNNKSFDLFSVIHQAKQQCYLKYLNGAAVTTYGI